MGLIFSSMLALGLLIGLLVGLAGNEVVNGVLGALFVFVGGTAAGLEAYLRNTKIKASLSILALSLGCIVGLVSGILAIEYRFFSPSNAETAFQESILRALRDDEVSISTAVEAYKTFAEIERSPLRSLELSEIERIHEMYIGDTLSAEQAYARLHETLTAGQ